MGLNFLDSICYFQIPDLLSLLVMYRYFFLLFRQKLIHKFVVRIIQFKSWHSSSKLIVIISKYEALDKSILCSKMFCSSPV